MQFKEKFFKIDFHVGNMLLTNKDIAHKLYLILKPIFNLAHEELPLCFIMKSVGYCNCLCVFHRR